MSKSLIENNLKEAQKVLEQFISDNKNIEAIENAGKLLADSINTGNKIKKIQG